MSDPVATAVERRDAYLEEAIRQLDAYRVERTLAEKPGFTTELASRPLPDGSLEYVVLKHVGLEFANPELWRRYGTIRSAHLPRLIETIQLPDELVVVLQFIQGESLDAYVARAGTLDLAAVRSVMDDLCDAAEALATAGIVHRDIKPSNVVLAFDGAHLIDPGIARVIRRSNPEGPKDQDTTVLGSWGYAAPEQLGFAPTDARSDVFSLGRVLGFMLTGLSPIDPDYPETLRNTRRIPESLRLVVTRACALEPSLRPRDAQTLKQLVDIESQGELETPPQVVTETSGYRSRPSTPSQGPASVAHAAPDTPRAVRRRKLAIAVDIAFFGFFGTTFCIFGFFVDTPSLPPWGNVLYGFAMGILGNYLPCYELVRDLRRIGIYADPTTRRRTCTRRILVWWALCFAILVFVAMIAQATGWQRPS